MIHALCPPSIHVQRCVSQKDTAGRRLRPSLDSALPCAPQWARSTRFGRWLSGCVDVRACVDADASRAGSLRPGPSKVSWQIRAMQGIDQRTGWTVASPILRASARGPIFQRPALRRVRCPAIGCAGLPAPNQSPAAQASPSPGALAVPRRARWATPALAPEPVWRATASISPDDVLSRRCVTRVRGCVRAHARMRPCSLFPAPRHHQPRASLTAYGALVRSSRPWLPSRSAPTHRLAGALHRANAHCPHVAWRALPRAISDALPPARRGDIVRAHPHRAATIPQQPTASARRHARARAAIGCEGRDQDTLREARVWPTRARRVRCRRNQPWTSGGVRYSRLIIAGCRSCRFAWRRRRHRALPYGLGEQRGWFSG
ncbi:hypothetical protein PsYK624_099610 [Phanerochaete sordida]|uniref:Uncharacterized protein n=1 Tax=Phanerochaete sordida TaxID=48140 RepID=A0A9P3GHN2_9APHY|nr:hypothetical protein PsYK624_099610 [Phanerochaete sordida]